MEYVVPSVASIGPAHMVTKNNTKPGISRLFHLRLIQRAGEMLRAIRRNKLPGVEPTDQVKTVGSRAWKGCGPVVRLMTPADSVDYGRAAAHSLKTLLEGTKGRAADKVAEDVAAVRSLRTTAPALSDAFVQQLTDESLEVIAACRKRMKEGRPVKGKRRDAQPAAAVEAPGAVSSSAVLAVSGEMAAESAEADGRAAEAVVRSQSLQSVASGSSGGGSEGEAWQEDDTVSEADSRDCRTDDSWEDEESAAPTDPFGFSPGREDEEDEERVQQGRSPSPACSSGEESSESNEPSGADQ